MSNTGQPRLCRACGPRGADMGRRDHIPEDAAPQKLRLRPLTLYDGACYDKGGAYWGSGTLRSGFMWAAWNPDQSALIFVRAVTRDAAKAEVQRVMPQARFHR